MGFKNKSNKPVLRTAQYVYPSLKDGITIQTAEGDWELGGMTELIPSDTITKDFAISAIVIEQANRRDKVHEIVLYAGENEIEVARRRFVVDAHASGVVPVDIDTRFLPADTCVTARLAIQGAGEKVVVISLQYETRG